MLANALDFDDGHRLTKGHPGVVVIPAALAIAESTHPTVDELRTAIIVGYEVAIRAGLDLHARSLEYHASGAWGALGAAAAAGRLLGLDETRMRHALGLAAYHAPIAPIMRSVADPAMTKDACGWGTLVGVSSASLARDGFTALASDVAAGADLGVRWHLLDIYVKTFPCCRFAPVDPDGAPAARREGCAGRARARAHSNVRGRGGARLPPTGGAGTEGDTYRQSQFSTVARSGCLPSPLTPRLAGPTGVERVARRNTRALPG